MLAVQVGGDVEEEFVFLAIVVFDIVPGDFVVVFYVPNINIGEYLWEIFVIDKEHSILL